MACTDDTRATVKAAAINFVMVSSHVAPAALRIGGMGDATGTGLPMRKAAQDSASKGRPRSVKTDSG